jgi:hypothetical protein
MCFVLPEKDEYGEGAKLSDYVSITKGVQALRCTVTPGFVAFKMDRICPPGDIELE